MDSLVILKDPWVPTHDIFLVEGDVDEVRDGFVRGEGDVVEAAGPGSHLSAHRGFGCRHHQLQRALAGLRSVHGEGYRSIHLFEGESKAWCSDWW